MTKGLELDYEAVVLAGGRGSRMGSADKGLVRWRGKPLIDHLLDRLHSQTVTPRRILISANRNLDQYQLRATVVQDLLVGFEGPLRGIQAAMRVCKAPYLLVTPCDTPLLPDTLAERLYASACGHAASASAAGVEHPLCCLLPVDVGPELDAYLACGQRKVKSFLSSLDAVAVQFGDAACFVNFNSPDMLD